MGLADRNQGDFRGIPPDGARGGSDTAPHGGEAFRQTRCQIKGLPAHDETLAAASESVKPAWPPRAHSLKN